MKYSVKILWERKESDIFTNNKYSRKHKWIFDCGLEIPASSSPQVVPLPMSDESAVDPEEAFVASLSSCHMLFFLSIAAAKNYCVEAYSDNAEGLMGKDENGKIVMLSVSLYPVVLFSGANIPVEEEINEMHKSAHNKCYIANSVKTVVKVIPS